MDDDGETRGVEPNDLLQRRPRVSAVGAKRVQESVHHDNVLPIPSSAAVVEAVIPGRDSGAEPARGEEEERREEEWEETSSSAMRHEPISCAPVA